jgi:hypothetical protein
MGYPPLVLDDSIIVPLLNGDGVGFGSKKDARLALLWWIICTLPLAPTTTRRKWANEVLREESFMAINMYTIHSPWQQITGREAVRGEESLQLF